MNEIDVNSLPSRWLAWWAWLTVASLCPLLLLGALVTTMGVGMADPRPVVLPTQAIWEFLGGTHALDWKLEHSHRLAGWFAGLCGIGLALGFWIGDKRQGFRWLGLLGLTLISFQGLLGFYRVQLHAILGPDLAWIHGCFAQIVFAVLVCVASAASMPYHPGAQATGLPSAPVACAPGWSMRTGSLACIALVFGQLILGGVIRHAPHNLIMARAHMLTAFVVLAGLLWLAMLAFGNKDAFGRTAWILIGLLSLQIVLGVEASIGWLARCHSISLGEGAWDLSIRTAHYFVGSMVFACTAAMAIKERIGKVCTLEGGAGGQQIQSDHGWHG